MHLLLQFVGQSDWRIIYGTGVRCCRNHPVQQAAHTELFHSRTNRKPHLFSKLPDLISSQVAMPATKATVGYLLSVICITTTIVISHMNYKITIISAITSSSDVCMNVYLSQYGGYGVRWRSYVCDSVQ